MFFSEKRTYIFNKEMIFIKKVRQHESKKFYFITYENLVTKEEYTVKDNILENAVRTVDSTQFFRMWSNYNNWYHKDKEYAIKHCLCVLETLKKSKIEMHGSNKFEEYDFKHLKEIYNAVYDIKCTDIESIIHGFDGGYTYHIVYDQNQRNSYNN